MSAPPPSGAVPPGTAAEPPAEPPAENPAGPTRRHPRRRTALLLALLLAVGVLALLTWPLAGVRGDADGARRDLAEAVRLLREGEDAAAADRVASAREQAARAHEAATGAGAAVWGVLPGVDGALDDVARLTSALVDLGEVADLAVEGYPRVAGEGADLVEQDEATGDVVVDLAVLEGLVGDARRAGSLLAEAQSALDEVEGDAPVVGERLAQARDEALAEVAPARARLDDVAPLIDVLPRLVGADGGSRLLVAVLNPAELRYSGGATLAFSAIRADDGRARFRDVGNYTELGRGGDRLFWDVVEGDPFLTPGRSSPLTTATFNPSWPVAGEELLRAYRAASNQEFDGVLAIDVPAVADLLRVTGPVQAPGYGEVDADNATELFVGSYDRFPSQEARRRLNDAVLGVLRDRLLDGGDVAEKVRSLADSARGRHVVLYHRDAEVQAAWTALGVEGALSTTEHDYLGVFTQNLNAAKVDYWQRRSVTSRVDLADDGSARVAVRTVLRNASPPYAGPGTDPGEGYLTRLSRASVGVFLPEGADLRSVRVGGRAVAVRPREAQGRRFVEVEVEVPQGAERTLSWSYDVPAAATPGGGGLVYALDVDPQGMVEAPTVSVEVRAPRGWEVTSVPEGWQDRGGRASVRGHALVDSPRWRIVLAPR